MVFLHGDNREFFCQWYLNSWSENRIKCFGHIWIKIRIRFLQLIKKRLIILEQGKKKKKTKQNQNCVLMDSKDVRFFLYDPKWWFKIYSLIWQISFHGGL
jgi:hypothetical protein